MPGIDSEDTAAPDHRLNCLVVEFSYTTVETPSALIVSMQRGGWKAIVRDWCRL